MSHFNRKAANWDDEQKVQMMAKLAVETCKRLKFPGKLHIMDFGCGTGLFGLEFTDHARTLTGVDTSDGMLEVFNRKTKGHDHIRSICIDLETESLDSQFDLILTSMAFHHLTNPSAMIGKFKTMLRENGTIALVDLDEEDGTFHPDNEGMGVKHFGFSKETVQGWAKEHRLSLEHSVIFELDKNGSHYRIFLAVLKLHPL